MPKLLDLPKADRKEKTRAIARMVFAAMEPCDDEPAESTVNGRFYTGMAEWGMAEDQEFYGEAFSSERQQLIDEFEVFFKEGQAYATMYDECIARVEQAAPNFAVHSDSLLRMWCIAHYWKALAKDDGPFADLQVVAGNGMDEGDEEQEGSEEGSGEEEEADDDEDDELETAEKKLERHQQQMRTMRKLIKEEEEKEKKEKKQRVE